MAVQDCGLAGTYDEVWFFRDAFVTFVQALAQFTVCHEGEARLESMSPGEAVLSIRQLDMARHVLAEAPVARGHSLPGHSFYDRVCGTFQLAPPPLPEFMGRSEPGLS